MKHQTLKPKLLAAMAAKSKLQSPLKGEESDPACFDFLSSPVELDNVLSFDVADLQESAHFLPGTSKLIWKASNDSGSIELDIDSGHILLTWLEFDSTSKPLIKGNRFDFTETAPRFLYRKCHKLFALGLPDDIGISALFFVLAKHAERSFINSLEIGAYSECFE